MLTRSVPPDGDATLSASGNSARARLFAWIIGSRYSDALLRVLILIDVVSMLLPKAYESFDGLYVLFHLSAIGLAITAAFAPTTAGLVAVALIPVHALMLPNFLNQMEVPATYAIAVLLGRLQWKRAVLVAALLALGVLGAEPALQAAETATPPDGLVFILLNQGLIGLALGLAELRVRKEINRRAAAAVEHERMVQRERTMFSINTHDTVSRGLAMQAAMLQAALTSDAPVAERPVLVGLAAANTEVQLQLRDLIRALRAEDANSGALTVLTAELDEDVRKIRKITESLGAELDAAVRVETLPERISTELFHGVRYLLLEIVTNMMKHASTRSDWRLRVEGVPDGSVAAEVSAGHVLRITAKNPSASPEAQRPWSLSERLESMGGRCGAECYNHFYRVTIDIPLK